ncbi:MULTISPECIES: chemotaxis protein CheW [unclassified Wenzhouxiangella]|uniref:chemotaxis protein CheW n=1 Tax=unclassified Wenzhouxiangella TaxID=2613841 RepID=UPI000E32ABD5|nr:MULTISPECIES: chemotaxis protein CheW [unclassified Wenzhouxiangella]RFF28360.1 chemotaxis protein CheW [Wenzhouxiangella sp. 15181]RFP69877.1 chemotaxis protein CheW [Wenzhouxiangella sp. 15190]
MQGDQQLATATGSGRLSLFARLAEYEKRSLEHDVGEAARQQQISNWDGVVFRLGDYYLTCRIDQVEEIIAFPPYTALPGAKDWLLGIANVRGNLAPVSDLGWYLFGSRTPVTNRTRLIITRMQGRLAGLVVDEVFGQRHFHTDDRKDEADWNDTPLSGLVSQQFETSERTWGVLRIDKLQRNQEFINGARED